VIADRLLAGAIDLVERGLVPDRLVRIGIRQFCRQRLREESGRRDGADPLAELVAQMSAGPIAPVPEAANAQHYEAPVELFEHALGPHLKYSCGYWPAGVSSLAEAERAALSLTVEHAGLANDQDILELGCGWGSLTLEMASRFPASRIVAVSNSHRQRTFILARAAEQGLRNVEVVTADINGFETERRFDRVVSVEMFEHMRNYEALLARIARWLRPDGKLFVHIFCHRDFAYTYSAEGAGNWMGRYFFTGGLMPSASLLYRFQKDMHVTREWRWDGTHYEKTANAWLANLDASRDRLMPVFGRHYGAREAARWFARWRMFFMACAELWACRQGGEWLVAHYLLEPGGAAAAEPRRDAA
jgi:cyclopropane-fatty-acyl-phospholipid synthase